MKILLIDDHVLFRAGLRLLLDTMRTDLEILEGATCAEAFGLARAHPDIRLCLLDLKLKNEDGMGALSHFKESFPDIVAVVVSADENLSSVYRALEEGAMGFIPKSVTPEVMTQALNLVLAGGIYLPSSLLDRQRHEPAGMQGPDGAETQPDLTQRQLEVLQGLLRGWPNKLISRHLGLSDNTVKSHLSAVFRALNVTSRSQAVIAAGRLGIRADIATPDGKHDSSGN